MPVRIVLADDHPIIRRGIGALVADSNIEVVACVGTADQIVPTVVQMRPDVLVTEVRLQDHDALKSLESLPAPAPCPTVVFSSSANPSNIARASALGCFEFIAKTRDDQSLLTAIQSAAAGGETPADSLLMNVKSRMKNTNRLSTDSPLTNRETQVLRHVSLGLKNREIGKSLGISVETVKEHVQNILRKLNVNDRTQAAVWAIQNNFI